MPFKHNLTAELAHAAAREQADPVSARELWIMFAIWLCALALLLCGIGYLGTESGQAWLNQIDGLGGN